MSISQLFRFLIFICFCALGIAYSAEIFFEVKPCALCYWQRYLYMLTLGGAFYFLFKPFSKAVLICGGLFLINAFVALYQVLIERHWISAPAFCKKIGSGAVTLEDLRRQLVDSSIPVAACDTVTWEFLGLSMATYNMLFCLGIAIMCVSIYFLYAKQENHDKSTSSSR